MFRSVMIRRRDVARRICNYILEKLIKYQKETRHATSLRRSSFFCIIFTLQNIFNYIFTMDAVTLRSYKSPSSMKWINITFYVEQS